MEGEAKSVFSRDEEIWRWKYGAKAQVDLHGRLLGHDEPWNNCFSKTMLCHGGQLFFSPNSYVLVLNCIIYKKKNWRNYLW